MKIKPTSFKVFLIKFIFISNSFLSVIIAATEDKAWRVRLSLAKNFPQVISKNFHNFLNNFSLFKAC